MNIHVIPLKSTRSGRPVANHYVMASGNTFLFQSYESLIAEYNNESGILTLGKHWDYSVTTMKYLNQFILEYCYHVYRELPDGKSGADSIRRAIKSGLIIYDENMV